MLSESAEPERPPANPDVDEVRSRRAAPSPRRKRPLRLIIARRLDSFFRVRHMYRLAFVLVPLAGFIHVSMLNGVLESEDLPFSKVTVIESPQGITPASGGASGTLAESRTADDAIPWLAGQDASSTRMNGATAAAASGSAIGSGSGSGSGSADGMANGMAIGQPIRESTGESAREVARRAARESIINAGDGAAYSPAVDALAMEGPTVRVTVLAHADTMIARSRANGTIAGDEAAAAAREPVLEPIADGSAAHGAEARNHRVRSSTPRSYVVNEGGSLWRTGRRFIKDEALLDAFIDSLAANGMDVRNVPVGFTFIVDDLGADGLLVVSERSGDSFATHIFDDNVITAVRPSKREVRGDTPSEAKPGVWRSEDSTQTALLQ